MKQTFKLIYGILGLLIASGILLLSDLSNRESKKTMHPNQKLKICLVHYVDSPNSENCEDGIIGGFKDSGLEEDIHYTLQRYNAQGDISTLNSIVEQVGTSTWDIVLSTSTPTIQALSKKISNSPIVFTNVGDPIMAGLGESFTEHNPNMTGISTMSDFAGVIKVIKGIQPGTKRIGTVFTPAEINSVSYKSRLEQVAQLNNLELIAVPANTSTEVYDAAVSLSLKNVDAFCQISDNLTASCSSSIIKVAQNAKIPYYAFISKQVEQGAVAAAARDYFQAGFDAAKMAVHILHGENPANIPYRFVTKTIYKFNLKVAEELTLQIPDEILKLSDSDQEFRPIHEEKLKLCMVHYVNSQPSEDCEKGIRQALKDIGLEETDNFTMQVFNAHGNISNLNSITNTIAASHWDIIFSSSTPTIQALAKKINDSPIVFTNVADPIKAGLGETFHNHRQNITGISTQGDFQGIIDAVLSIHPGIKRVGTVFTPGEINSVSNKNNMEKAAVARGIELVAVPANTPAEVYEAAVALTLKNIEAYCQIGDNLTASCSSSLLKVAKDNKIPYYGLISDQIELGAILVAARDYFQAGYDSGMLARRILEGENPGDIPFRLVSKTVYTLNEEAVEFYNLPIPEEINNKTKQK